MCLFDTIYFIDTIYLTHTAAFEANEARRAALPFARAAEVACRCWIQPYETSSHIATATAR